MNRVNKVSIAIVSAFFSIGAGSTFARGPIAPAGPAASSSGIDLGQPQVTPPAQVRKEIGSPPASPNAATPAMPSSASGTAATPAMPGNPIAGEQVGDNRDTDLPQNQTGVDARAKASSQSNIAPSSPKDRYGPAVPGTSTMPSVRGDAGTRNESRSRRDASSVHSQENAGARADAVNESNRAATSGLPSNAQDK